MVELVEVEDESFETKNQAGLEDDEEYYTDTGTPIFIPASADTVLPNMY